MPTTEVLVNGQKITVDNSRFDVKFTRSVQQLDAGLSKAKKALGLFYNQNQQLNDAMGRCVEGLSTWQLQLGMWVDETGKARTIAGGFADGLSRTELELGYYADETGKVCKRTGEFVRETQAAVQAEKEYGDSLQRTRERFSDAFDALGDGAGRMSSLLVLFDGLGEGANEAHRQIARLGSSFDVASQTFSTVQNLFVGFKEASSAVQTLNKAIAASTGTAQKFQAALTAIGGPWALISAGIAAASAALILFNETASETKKLSLEEEVGESAAEAFKDLAKRAKEAGDEIRGVADVLKYGAFRNADVLGLNELENQINDLSQKKKSLEADREKEKENAAEIVKFGGMGVGPVAGRVYERVDELTKEINGVQGQLEPLEAQYNEIATDLIKKLREEQKTEEEKANELKRQYQNLFRHAETDEDRAAIERKINSIDDDIAESKAKELADQQKRLADQRDALAKELGISLDFSPVQTEEERFAADLAKLRAAFEDGSGLIESSEELEEAERRLAQKYSEAKFADWLSNIDSLDDLSELTKQLAAEKDKGVLGQAEYNKILAEASAKEKELVDAQLDAIPGLRELIDANDAAKKAEEDYAKALKIAEEYSEESPFDKGDVFSQEQLDILKNGEDETLRSAMIEYASAMETAAEGLKNQVISQETYDELVKRANENLAKAADESAKKMRDKVRSELGIDDLMESLKSPAQKYQEKLEKAAKALEKEQITKEEFNALQEKLAQDWIEQQQEMEREFDREFEKGKDQKTPEKKTDLSKSMKSGSEELYLAQVKNSTSNYQSRIQATTDNLYKTSQESLWQSQQTNYYLQEMLEGSGSLAVFG